MRAIRGILKVIDSISQWTGSSARWLGLALVLVGSYDTVMRYAFNAPTVWAYETCIMLGGSMVVLGWAYDHLHNYHIRIDIFYTRFSPKKKALFDVVCAAIFLFPLMVTLAISCVSWLLQSLAMHETMAESYWYPPAWPYRAAILLGVCILILQGLAIFIRDLYFIIKGKHLA